MTPSTMPCVAGRFNTPRRLGRGGSCGFSVQSCCAVSVLDAPGSREYHILFSFTDRRSLRAWLDSEERRRLLDRGG
jgi:hypothetical protein